MQQALQTFTMTKKEATAFFKICAMTLDNWVRTSIPEALNGKRYNPDVIRMYIEEQKKLNSRANKKECKDIEVPKGLLRYSTMSGSWIPKFLDYIKSSDYSSDQIADSLIDVYETRICVNSGNSVPSVFLRKNKHLFRDLAALLPHQDMYCYSIAYQLLLSGGDKSSKGSYFTAMEMVLDSINGLVSRGARFFEPCCGVGFIVTEYIKAYFTQYSEYPNQLIHANDIDARAAKITELNILRVTNGEMPDFKVTSHDALQLEKNNFDLIVTNPPYGLRNRYEHMKTKEIFSHFIHKIMKDFLTDGGRASLILPKSALNVAKHLEIRKFLLSEFRLEQVQHYGRTFDAVYSEIVRLLITKKRPADNVVQIFAETNKSISQRSLIDNNFLISNTDELENQKALNYYKVPHYTLERCSFSVGIITGNNKDFISDTPGDGYVQIISGREIEKGSIDYQPKKFLLNQPQRFMQRPMLHLFPMKKIVYRFICKDIISAVDTTGIYTLNSANIIVIDDPSIPLSAEYISAILNSSAINDLYKIKNCKPLKVLKSTLIDLPIFDFGEEIQSEIESNYIAGRHRENDILINEKISAALYSCK